MSVMSNCVTLPAYKSSLYLCNMIATYKLVSNVGYCLISQECTIKPSGKIEGVCAYKVHHIQNFKFTL